MRKPTLVQRAISLAVTAHAGYEDPPGEPYIIHPMRVMLAVSASDDAHQNENLRCVAILHDVLERTRATERDLRKAKMPVPVIAAIKLLTHERKTEYGDYIIRLKSNPLARVVKIADLLDNADLRHVTFRATKLKKDIPRVVRYAASYQYLTDQIDKKMYRRVMEHGQKGKRELASDAVGS